MISTLGIRPELCVSVLASRENLDPEIVESIQALLAKCSKMDALVAYCTSAQVYPLVARNLNRLSLAHPLSASLAQLTCRTMRWLRQREKLLEFAVYLRKLMEHVQIQFCFMRGLSFAETYWLYPELRPSDDLDLLIEPADVNRLKDILLGEGFIIAEEQEKALSRARYMGQTEFYHKDYGFCLDVNWRLTGNASIGKVSLDMDGIWTRMHRLSRHESQLSAEDAVTDIARHVCHGHDFGHCLLKSCVDINAVLRKAQADFDWSIVQRNAATGEFLRGLDLLGTFFNHLYRHEQGNEAKMPSSCGNSCRRRYIFFQNYIYGTGWAVQSFPKPIIRQLLQANVRVCAKFWALDSVVRMARIVWILAWPSADELNLMANRRDGDKIVWLILRHWLYCLLRVPGMIFGCCLWFCCWLPTPRGRTGLYYDRIMANPSGSDD